MPAPLVPEVYTPVPQRTQSQSDFDNHSDFFLASLPGVATGMNALGAYLDALAVEVDSDASFAATQAQNANISANSATASAQSAANSAAQAAQTVQDAAQEAIDSASSFAAAAQTSALASAASALTATQQAALATASVASGAKPYATYALALADLANIATNQIVDVVTDETRNGQRSLYQDNGTTLVFLRAVEQYFSPVPYVAPDSIQNYITRLLVATGRIPQVKAGITSNFVTESYTLG